MCCLRRVRTRAASPGAGCQLSIRHLALQAWCRMPAKCQKPLARSWQGSNLQTVTQWLLAARRMSLLSSRSALWRTSFCRAAASSTGKSLYRAQVQAPRLHVQLLCCRTCTAEHGTPWVVPRQGHMTSHTLRKSHSKKMEISVGISGRLLAYEACGSPAFLKLKAVHTGAAACWPTCPGRSQCAAPPHTCSAGGGQSWRRPGLWRQKRSIDSTQALCLGTCRPAKPFSHR